MRQLLCVVVLAVGVSYGQTQEWVRASLRKSSVIAGEGNVLNVTLLAPGPFSGTASFDLPEVSGLFIVPQGSPVVGTLTEGGTDYFTQVHEFRLYAQREGPQTLEPIAVRYEARPSAMEDPKTFSGDTGSLSFDVSRPEGADSGVVVVADGMSITQRWDPDLSAEIAAGGVVTRTIVRQATGTTAMMLPPPEATAPEGVRVYVDPPRVKDRSQRGEVSAERIDVIKYQLVRGGTIELPDMNFTWWTPGGGEAKTQTLEGQTLTVTAPPTSLMEPATRSDGRRGWILLLFCVLALLGYFRKWIIRRLWSIREKLRTPERCAWKSVRLNCRRNDARASYHAVMVWKRSCEDPALPALEEWEALRGRVYGSTDPNGKGDWNGTVLLGGLQELRRSEKKTRKRRQSPVLPPLNPSEG